MIKRMTSQISPQVEQHCPGADYWWSISPVLVCRRRQILPIAREKGFNFSTPALDVFSCSDLLRLVLGQRSSWVLAAVQSAIYCQDVKFWSLLMQVFSNIANVYALWNSIIINISTPCSQSTGFTVITPFKKGWITHFTSHEFNSVHSSTKVVKLPVNVESCHNPYAQSIFKHNYWSRIITSHTLIGGPVSGPCSKHFYQRIKLSKAVLGG